MTNDEGNVVKISPFTHTQLSLATFKGGIWRRERRNVATGKRISKLENWEISKFVGGV